MLFNKKQVGSHQRQVAFFIDFLRLPPTVTSLMVVPLRLGPVLRSALSNEQSQLHCYKTLILITRKTLAGWSLAIAQSTVGTLERQFTGLWHACMRWYRIDPFYYVYHNEGHHGPRPAVRRVRVQVLHRRHQRIKMQFSYSICILKRSLYLLLRMTVHGPSFPDKL